MNDIMATRGINPALYIYFPCIVNTISWKLVLEEESTVLISCPCVHKYVEFQKKKIMAAFYYTNYDK